MILLIVPLTVPFVATSAVPIAAALHRFGPRLFVPVVLTGFSLYLATILGLAAFGMLRLQAWRRAHPWTPPEPTRYTPLGVRVRSKTR